MTDEGEYNVAYKYTDGHVASKATHVGHYELG